MRSSASPEQLGRVRQRIGRADGGHPGLRHRHLQAPGDRPVRVPVGHAARPVRPGRGTDGGAVARLAARPLAAANPQRHPPPRSRRPTTRPPHALTPPWKSQGHFPSRTLPLPGRGSPNGCGASPIRTESGHPQGVPNGECDSPLTRGPDGTKAGGDSRRVRRPAPPSDAGRRLARPSPFVPPPRHSATTATVTRHRACRGGASGWSGCRAGRRVAGAVDRAPWPTPGTPGSGSACRRTRPTPVGPADRTGSETESGRRTESTFHTRGKGRPGEGGSRAI